MSFVKHSRNHYFTFVCILCCLHFAAFAQNQKPDAPPAPSLTLDKFYTGGNFGLNFGTVTAIDISPIIGYKITEKFSAGVGVIYMYYSDSRYNYSTNAYGGRLFARHLIIENLFAHAEYELINRDAFDYYNRVFRVNVSGFLVGGGYTQRIAGNSYFNIMVLWNLNENKYSFYPNPIIRMGFSVGL